MEDYISISTLNDYIFCPYSIYLHNVYMDADKGLYHATPQTKGRIAHETVDSKKSSNKKNDLQSFPVYSERYKLMGKIDIYKEKEKILIERKYNRKQFSHKDFKCSKGEYQLKSEKNAEYTKVFFEALIPYKIEIFKFIRSYYRCFMQNKAMEQYPKFEI